MNIKVTIATSIAIILGSSTAFANPVPQPHRVVSGTEVAQLFSGKTWEWDKGHAYFAPDGTFQAAIGYEESAEGKWYATTAGKMCFDVAWRVGKRDRPVLQCWQHVVDSAGQLWQARVTGTGLWADWTIFDAENQLVAGNPHKFDFDVASGRKERLPVKRVDGRDVAKMYFDKTWKWKDGYAYFGNNGTLTATAAGDSVGEGKWYATDKGDLCIDAEWRGPNYDATGKKRCWLHAKDEKGRLWQVPTDDMRAWNVFEPNENLINGNPYSNQFDRLSGKSDR